MADGPDEPADKAADPGGDCRQQARADRGRGGAAAGFSSISSSEPKSVEIAVCTCSTPDEAGEKVRDALVDAARRGVEVRLLIDGFGSAAPTSFSTCSMRRAREDCVFNPSYGRRYLLRNHQKLVIIDDRVAIIGGANIDALI